MISGISCKIGTVDLGPLPYSEELFSNFSLGRSDKVYFQKSDA